jgi:subtilisin family serine protease
MCTISQWSNFILKNILPVHPPTFIIKRNHLIRIFLSIICTLSLTNIYAQHSELVLSNGEHVRLDNPNGGVSSVIIKDGKVQSVQKENPQEIVHLIVTFKEKSLAAYQNKKSLLQKASLSSVYIALQASHASFRTALNTIQQQSSLRSQSVYDYTIKRDYYRALNGVALECKRGMIEKIRALPMVQQVRLDDEVKINLKESIHQIRADIVQDSLGYKGKGVLIGDIDTGIDYDNPALGGGFGSGFRVIGGYDFVNNDSDPMDDHGHGTHVAGIIGANSGDTLRGVAPEVKFLAVKVLDAKGNGWVSDVIAGIEYCLDPDGNPATDDAVDIINISLGAAPVSDNPLDSAVNNATNAGVLSVVAAGNSGAFGYGTVSSPGTSETALTVGACDSVNHVASFSSRGPDPLHSSIKPEVIAPGVNILSTVLHNETASWSGTSMATPHVTGTAALLKQQHPTWTPEELKAAIVNSAHSVGDSVSLFAQGNGRVDALDAASLGMVVEPGVISFRRIDLALKVWTDTVKLKIKNFRNVSQNIQLHVLEGLPSGATLTFNQTSFSLAPAEEATISAVLTVPVSVPVVATDPFAYLGKVEFVSDSDNVIVPFSFIKSTILIITSDMPLYELYIANRVTANIQSVNAQGATKYIIPTYTKDSLDILAHMRQDTLGAMHYYFVEHRIDNQVGLTYVFLSHEEASINMLNDTIYDIRNNKIDVDPTTNVSVKYLYIVNGKKGILKTGLFLENGWDMPFSQSHIFFSPLNKSDFSIEKIMTVSQDSEIYVLQKSIDGLISQQDIAFTSGSDNLIGFNFTAAYDNPLFTGPSRWAKYIDIYNKRQKAISGGMSTETNGMRIRFPFVSGKYYFNKQEIKNTPYDYRSTYLCTGYSSLDTTSFVTPFLCTPEFTFNEKGEAVFEQNTTIGQPENVSTAYIFEVVKPGETINIENNLYVNFPNFTTFLKNDFLYMTKHYEILSADLSRQGNGGTMQSNGVCEATTIVSSYWNLPCFAQQVFANNRSQISIKPYQPWDPSHFPSEGIDYIHAYNVFENVKKNVGVYKVISDAPYTLLGQSGRCAADFEYQMANVTSTLPNSPFTNGKTFFPSFSLIQISIDGKPTNLVRPGQNGTIRLVLFDLDSSVTSVTLSLLLTSGEEIVVPASYYGKHEYIASIPTTIPAGFIDVIARASDTHGNKIELTTSPAFYYGNSMDSLHYDARLRMTTYKLNNVDAFKYNIGDTLDYTITYTNFGNTTARNITATFPTTPYFKPIGPTTFALDSLGVNDTVRIPVRLIFLGNNQSAVAQVYYTPTITWTSNGTSYLRKHNVLVDLQGSTTSVATTGNMIPDKFELYQNYPNPFNPSTTIKYDIAKAGHVSMDVYNILGQQVVTLVNEMQPAGRYSVLWDGRTRNGATATGIYFLRIRAENYVKTIKMLMLK